MPGYVLTLPMHFILSDVFMLFISSHFFQSEELLEHVLQERSGDDDLPQLLFLWADFISPSFPKDSFAGYSILGC
jgi:hypothetical protein